MTFDRFSGAASVLGGLVLALHSLACTPELQLDGPDAGPGVELDAGPDDGVDAGREPPTESDAGLADAAGPVGPVVLAGVRALPGGLVFDDHAAYVMTRADGPDPAGQIVRIDRASGVVTALVSSTEPGHLTADRSFLFWSDRSDGWIRRVDKLGGGATKLGHAGAEVTHLAVGETGAVVWATSAFEVRLVEAQSESGAVLRRFEGPVTGLVVDGADAVVSLASGEMWRLPLAGGEAKRLFADESFEHGFVTDGRRFYWIDGLARSIRSGHLDGGEAHQIVADLPDGIAHLAVSYRYVIWSDPAGGSIRRAFKTGTGPVETLAGDLAEPAELAALDFWVAWVNRGDGAVMAMPL